MAEGPLPLVATEIVAVETHVLPKAFTHAENGDVKPKHVEAHNNAKPASYSDIDIEMTESVRKPSIITKINGPKQLKGLVMETNSDSESILRTRSPKGILKSRSSDSQIILSAPILDPEKQSILSKFDNGTSVDNGGLTGVRFDLEYEANEDKPKRKIRSVRKKTPQIASFINPAFEKEDKGGKLKLSDLVQQLVDHSDDQADSHPYGRKAYLNGAGSSAFVDTSKFMVWVVLMVMLLGMCGGIIFLAEIRNRNSDNNYNSSVTTTTRSPVISTL